MDGDHVHRQVAPVWCRDVVFLLFRSPTDVVSSIRTHATPEPAVILFVERAIALDFQFRWALIALA